LDYLAKISYNPNEDNILSIKNENQFDTKKL